MKNEKQTPNVWEFVEKFYPNYYHSEEITRNGDLAKLCNSKSDIEEGDGADGLLKEEYGGDINNPQIEKDFIYSTEAIYREAIISYLLQQETVKIGSKERPYTYGIEAEGRKFARKCDITGEGMNEGFCIGDGEMYIKYEKDFIKHLEEETDYKTKEEAFDDEYYYHTEWEDEEDFQYIVKNGRLIEIED